MSGNSEWEEATFRRSLAEVVVHPPADADALWQFKRYWIAALDDAEACGAITGVERDVLIADLQTTARRLPGVEVVEHSSGVFLRMPFTKPRE
jgi:hypothetical protein